MINGLHKNTFDRERIKENALTSKFQEFQVRKIFDVKPTNFLHFYSYKTNQKISIKIHRVIDNIFMRFKTNLS